jgi:hypothetical protein
VNERNLSRGISTSVVDALKAHGHILVVKGGAAALEREMAEIMAPALALIEPRLAPRGYMSDEPSSTFGSDALDTAVEELVAQLTRALMTSDHVEDVFAEDAVIQRDIFRTMAQSLLSPALHLGGEDRATVTVKLDTLGYVAATVSKRADAGTLQQVFDRAAALVHARFSAYDPALREAAFQIEGGGDDERLELEEAVADELADLAEQGVAPLPTVERRVDVGRALSPAEQRGLAARIDDAAEATLLRSGYGAAWDFADPRTLRVTFTPLSEQDARGVDAPAGDFTREVAAILATGKPLEAEAAPMAVEPPALAATDTAPEAPAARRKAAARAKDADPPAARPPRSSAAKRAAAASEPEPAPKRKRAATAPKAPRSSAKRTTKRKTPAKKA